MFIAALVLTGAIHVEIDLGSLMRAHRVESPGVTCGIKTVGYRFAGKPGQEFRYAGETYTIPAEGSIELIAGRGRRIYRINNQSLPLDVEPLDQFGFRDVALPSPQHNAISEGSR